MPIKEALVARSKFLIDFLLWIPAFVFGLFLRLEFDVAAKDVSGVLTIALISSLLHSIISLAFGLYRNRVRHGSFDEFLSLGLSVFLTATVVFLFNLLFQPISGIPRSLPVISGMLFFLIAASSRIFSRAMRVQSRWRRGGKRAIIYGAGEVGDIVCAQLLTKDQSQFFPVAFIDDDPAKRGLLINGIPVAGSFAEISALAGKYRAAVLIVAVPAMKSEQLRVLHASARENSLEVLVTPTVGELRVNPTPGVRLSPISVEDLIGRRSVVPDFAVIGRLVANRTVLVTGAGGSIGSEICRQLYGMKPKNLIFLDRDETGLQEAQISAKGSGLMNSADFVLCDIRDSEVVQGVFECYRPDVVFHAAALKHVPVLERFPEEGWKTNVRGTLNVLRAAYDIGTKVFVNISTDKAASPTSVLGKSKSLSEGLTAWFGRQGSGRYVSVRFGNVLGSRGSLLPTVRSLIDKGFPVEITDARATRYFMSVQEACQLVLQAGALEDSDDVFILDMGAPVKISDVVNRLVEQLGSDVEINYTGLRPGEKLHEILASEGLERKQTSIPMISSLVVQPIDPEEVESGDFRSLLP